MVEAWPGKRVLRLLTWNGGSAFTRQIDLFKWLAEVQLHILFLQETRLANNLRGAFAVLTLVLPCVWERVVSLLSFGEAAMQRPSLSPMQTKMQEFKGLPYNVGATACSLVVGMLTHIGLRKEQL